MYAKVILDIPHSKVDRLFEYRVPKGMDLSPGTRVYVPFGQGGKREQGIVVHLGEACGYDEAKIKDILSPIDSFPALTGEQLELSYYIARKYHTPVCVALRLMYPAELRRQTVGMRTQRFVELTPGVDVDGLRAACCTKNGVVRAPSRLELINTLAREGATPFAGLTSAMKGAASKGIKEGWITERLEESRRFPQHVGTTYVERTLTEAQQAADSAIHIDRFGRYLLHGVTGSGKTEVYISVIRRCLRAGKSAILLVPEISLTPQLVMMLSQRINEPISVLHSSLTAGERFDEWRAIRNKRARVVVGARSAVFAPLENLGAIIIDEEHETSYKSDQHPKYTAHDVARERCRLNNCALVLGSATPSVETYHEAEGGGMTILRLKERMFGLPLPPVVVADMRDELRMGNRTMFSQALFDELERTFDMGKQAMLFINRRGYSTFVMCRGCGFTEFCDKCEVSMTYHASPGVLKCHYCGRTREVRTVCPECGKPYLKYFGIGTQKVEEGVKKVFPGVRTMRMDLDTCQKKNAHLEIYERFRAGEADVLIGTQMIAKGFDFENVRTVGVMAADTSLKIPDYRSAERTFSLIEQVSGRAGRKGEGVVVVQTYSPEHYAVVHAKAHDYEGFYADEINKRRALMLPPFGVYYRILFSGADEQKVMDACSHFEKRLSEVLRPYRQDVLMMEASPSPIKRIDGKTRYQVMLKTRRRDYIEDTLFKLMEQSAYDVAFGLDINP